MRHALICSSADKAKIPANAGNARLSGRQRRKLPSYMSGRSFARALVDTVIPDAAGKTKMDQIRALLNGLGDTHLRASLLALATAAADDVAQFRRNIEEWYDDHMARVSGWYKRHVRWISLALGVLLVLLFNLDAVQITRSLYTDQVLRASIVTEATRAAQCGTKDPATCLQDVRGQIDRIRGAGLPIGWARVSECAAPAKCSWWEQRGLASRTPAAGPGRCPSSRPGRLGAHDADLDAGSPVLVRCAVAARQPASTGPEPRPTANNVAMTPKPAALLRIDLPGSGARAESAADAARISISAVVAGGSGGSPYVAA